jgi:hypothetical protein
MLFVHFTELPQLRKLQSYDCGDYEGLTRKNIKIAFTWKTAENHEVLIRIIDLESNPESASSLSLYREACISIWYVTEGKLVANEKEYAVAYLREYTDIHIDIMKKITNNLNDHKRSEV